MLFWLSLNGKLPSQMVKWLSLTPVDLGLALLIFINELGDNFFDGENLFDAMEEFAGENQTVFNVAVYGFF